MTEERAPYLDTPRWVDVRFGDGKHTGVRRLQGTTIIEIQRDKRRVVVDTKTGLPIDLAVIAAYNE